jgi:hypothetical protein
MLQAVQERYTIVECFAVPSLANPETDSYTLQRLHLNEYAELEQRKSC